MGRILFFVVLLLALWIAWTISRRNRMNERDRAELRRLRRKERDGRMGESQAVTDPNTTMIRCEQCGVYFPESEAIRDQHGHRFCSETCQERFERRG